MHKAVGFLRLMRLANIVTAISDILAGIAIAGYFKEGNFSWFRFQPVLLLILATIGLYGGGKREGEEGNIGYYFLPLPLSTLIVLFSMAFYNSYLAKN